MAGTQPGFPDDEPGVVIESESMMYVFNPHHPLPSRAVAGNDAVRWQLRPQDA
jgi:hypothetical protein